MNPGDLYHDPSRRSYEPYDPNQQPIPQSPPHGGRGGQPFPAAPYLPSTTPNPYDNPPPQQQIHHSHSQPFQQGGFADPLHAPQQQGYGDPFRDSGASEQQWNQPPGSHHYPSYPLISPSTTPAPQHPSIALSPSRPHMTAEPARTRFDSNPAFIGVPHSGSYNSAINMPDGRMTSPPPMLHHSSSGMLYPPGPGGQYGVPHSNSFNGTADDGDINDSAPLLNHAQPAFGPGSASGRGYQLRDDGDMGTRGGAPGADEEDVNVHYGPVPTRVIRRNKTQKRVKLFQGHFVVDNEVPSILLNQCAIREGNEFTRMRYTAVTCDPNDFLSDHYTLRQRLYDPPRQTELFIVITMYNEDDELFCRTMRGVMQNVAHLCGRGKSKTWGKDGWKKVVICVVADGRLKMNTRTRSVLAALGVYQDGVGKNVINGKPVTAHLYEYTTQLWISKDNKIRGNEPQAVPVQMIFCMKEKNQKKINSHRWFFNAFGACLRPNVCVLLDVGTQPGPDSIYHLWKAFDINSSVGGACGEIVALKGLFWRNLINPLVAAQNFEYKMSNILDKPLESIFGYITVLPGAFSAYRYIALQNDEQGNGPLKQYFLGESMHGSEAGIFAANMYLAEDRILCWELVSKRACKWTLHYVKSAYGITDVPDAVPELVSQRRRWLNGSFFAAIHSVVHFGYLYRSSHSLTRKFFLHIEALYQVVNLIFSWFALGNFYIAFIVLTSSLNTVWTGWKYINIPLQYGYVALLLLCFLLSLGNRPAGSKIGYTISMIGFAVLTVYMLFAAIYLAVRGIQSIQQSGAVTANSFFGDAIFRNIVVSLIATYGIYILASLFALDPWHMVTSFLQYILLAPSYINVMNVYAFCNVHDVSWGTKGSDKVSEDLGVVSSDANNKNEVTVDLPVLQQDINAIYSAELQTLQQKAPKEVSIISGEQKQEDYYKNFRTNVLLAWTMSNGGLAAVILQTSGGSDAVATTYMGVMLYTVAGLAIFRWFGATAYLIVRMFAGE